MSQYSNKSSSEATIGWVDPHGGFTLQSTVGHLYEGPQNGANLAFYACKEGTHDYFVSTDTNCGGKLTLGLEGYGYAQAPAGEAAVPLDRCSSAGNHFVSTEPGCSGQSLAGALLGYALLWWPPDGTEI